MTLNYWDMSGAELAQRYRAVTSPFLDDARGENAETLAFIEDAIMQRIGAPENADPSVSEEWLAKLEKFVKAQA